MTGAVGGAVVQEQRLLSIGQRHQQGVIAPLAVVGHIHACLADAGRFHNATIGFDNGRLEKRVGVLLPDGQAFAVKSVHKGLDVRGLEAAQEIASGGRIGDALRAQDVEVGFVVAEQFEVIDGFAADQEIVGEVEDMVGL
jgi:hypothetical protein